MNESNRGASYITLDEVKQKLRDADLVFSELPISKESTILIMEWGGRILGPFIGDEGRSILWMPPWWDSRESFEEARSKGLWNLGGERLWIAPEIQFCIENRFDLTAGYSLPQEMDPGNYRIDNTDRASVSLETEMELNALHHTPTTQRLSVNRTIKPIKNPLRNINNRNSLMSGILFSGYNHSIRLHSLSSEACLAEAWSVMQVRQGGESIVPTYGVPQIGWYHRPQSSDLVKIEDSPILVHHKENNLFKIGIHSTSLTGRVGYLHNAEKNVSPYLIIRNYWVSPSFEYCEEPFASPGENGYAFHLYNSADLNERFGEIECHGNAMGGSSGVHTSTLVMDTWFFEGNFHQLEMIAHQLLSYPNGVICNA